MRGTLDDARGDGVDVGIIPACAGNTFCLRCYSIPFRDHPRVCGEHPVFAKCARKGAGSSPRVRGTRVDNPLRLRCHGIIPACAGNTKTIIKSFGFSRDHPRVCGEHFLRGSLCQDAKGSSPRVRGTLHRALGIDRHAGIIPACAGNTLKNPSSKYHNIQEIATFQ